MSFKSLLVKLLVALCLLISFPAYADENSFLVIDNNSGLNESFETYKAANTYYQKHLNEYENLLLYENDKLVRMEYGVIQFNVDNKYIDYYSEYKKEDDILCAAYGIDGAYLYTEDDDVYFKVAGDKGRTSIGNVTLIPYEELKVKISLYHTDDKYLYHNIKTQLDYEYYSSSLLIDFIPDYLDINSDYFSYDGHYFYDNFYLMIDDYNNETSANAINETPYYNYYQYLPYRTSTNYECRVLEDYFYNTLKIDSKLVRYNDLNMDSAADEINCSQLYDEIDDFYACQNVYGANALMLLSNAINESNYGKSYSSFVNNNLYASSAYDSSLEADTSRYNSISACINNQAKYFVSNRFANYKRDDYCGTFMGDRYGGITSTYTLDQYSGERLAATYFNLDNKLGLLDYNAYCIGIIDKTFNVYNDRELSDYSYSIDVNNELAFVILNEFEDSYLIQLDYTSDSNYLYDYEDCIGYISKDVVSYLINNEAYREDEYVTVTYDFNGGTYFGLEYVDVKTKKGSIPVTLEASLEGYEFTGYGLELEPVYEDTIYYAYYRGVSSVDIMYLFEKEEELYPSLDLSKATLLIKYEDGVTKKIPITSDMLSYVDNSLTGEQEVIVTFCGVSDSKTINISGEVANLYGEVTNAINNGNNTSLNADGEFAYPVSEQSLEYYRLVKDNIKEIDYPFTMTTIRRIDGALKLVDNRNYVINDYTKSYDLSISGLDLSLDDKSSYSFFKDTYYVEVNDISLTGKEKIESLAKGYDLQTVTGINISFKFNFQNIELNGPAIVQLDIADKDSNSIYTVYHLNDDGDIVKCRTTHSNNYVQFIINEEGDYLVLSKPSINTYEISNTYENLTYENMGFDNHKFNLNVLFITLLVLICLIGIIIYYIIRNKKDNEWKDYRKSLQKADTVLEEKPKN